jgi:adenylate cyclase class 1
VQAIAERSLGSGVSYRIFCGELEFVQSELGDDFFPAVAKYIASTRRSGELYPCYITDLDLSAIVLSRPLSTCDYLRHKERLEAAINATLNASVTA